MGNSTPSSWKSSIPSIPLGSRPLSEALTLGICHPAISCVIFLLLTCFVLFCFFANQLWLPPHLRSIAERCAPRARVPTASLQLLRPASRGQKGTRFLSLTAGSRMQRAGGDHPAPSGSGGWGGGAPDSQLLFITSTCVMYCVVDFLWSPQPCGPPTCPEEKFLTSAR